MLIIILTRQQKGCKMTDKQIIIDGVDVSGCGHYEDLNCFAYRDSCGYPLDCKDNPNCSYKQLKRKKQENEELKEEIKHYKQIAQYHGNLSVKYTNKSAKLKQTLAEIKPVLELYANSKIGEAQPDGTYKIIVEDSKVLGGMYITFDPKPAKQALQKISEVENEHNG